MVVSAARPTSTASIVDALAANKAKAGDRSDASSSGGGWQGSRLGLPCSLSFDINGRISNNDTVNHWIIRSAAAGFNSGVGRLDRLPIHSNMSGVGLWRRRFWPITRGCTLRCRRNML
jgi:hypothetical protein